MMNRLKYIGLLGAFLISTFSFAQTDRFTIVASASMISDIASNIALENTEIDMIVPIGGDPHRYQPTPGDAKLVQDADIVLINGLTFEGWITELVENSGTSAKTYTVTEGVDVLRSQTYENSSDPHAWMNALNGKIYAENIYKALSEYDPTNEAKYKERYEAYAKKLVALDQEIKEMMSEIPEKQRVLITSHDAFQYYGRQYGLQLEAIMGISTEAEAQTSDITRVTKAIQENRVPAIFVESTINPKLIQQIASDNNVSIGGELFADSIGDKDSPAPTYIEMLRYNSRTIANALKKEVVIQEDNLEDNKSESRMWFYIILGVLLLSLLPLVISKLRS